MKHLFAYGTLMCQDIMQQVAGCCPQSAPGTLYRFRRHAVRGEEYPGIRPDAAGRVEGVVYFAVPHWAWKRLDRFEGPMYHRQLLEVEQEGAIIAAGAYVVLPEFMDCLEERDWDFKERRCSGSFSRC
jgi:gamma-glutamylcyclotransferase (GGCT)/AIG2-like uncharacterized protein YtfP